MKTTPDVLNLFARQYWVAHSRQLDRLGVGEDQRRRARRSGMIEPVMRCVWRLSAAPFTVFGKRMALLLVGGIGSRLSHGTAGELYDLRKMPKELPCLCVPDTRRLVVPEWGQVRYTNWPDPDPTVRIDGLVITSPLRTAFDLGALLGPDAFESAAEDMWHKGLITPDVCHLFVQAVRRSGRRGVSRNIEWLEDAMTRERPAQSGLEVELARALVAAGLPAPRRQVPLLLPTLGLVKVDLGWEPIRFGLEPGHSDFHDVPEGLRYDTVRDDEAATLGWVIRRFNERQLVHMDRCVREIAQLYREREKAVRAGLL